MSNENYEIYKKKLSSVGVDSSALERTLGNSLKNGTFSLTNEYGAAYNGSLIDIVLRKITPYAVRINELLPQEKRVDKRSLVKVCLLNQIAKSVMIVPNDSKWEIEKRGILYKYKEDLPSIKCGAYSLYLSIKSGIYFTLEEVDGMIANDRNIEDAQVRWHSSLISTIVRQANELTYADMKKH